MSRSHPRIYLVYLGRRGPVGRLAKQLAQACRSHPRGGDVTFVLSRGCGMAGPVREVGSPVIELETFATPASPAVALNLYAAHRRLRADVGAGDAVVTLMPHLWTPLLGRNLRRRGARYATIIHDAIAHPGDPTGRLTRWLRSEASFADRVITLSRAVADQLAALHLADAARVKTLFHPDLIYDGDEPPRPPRTLEQPLRLLFFGRIMAYKGLDLLVEAAERLRRDGITIALGVAGDGDLDASLRERLAALGAEVIQRWLDDNEVGPLLRRYDAMALPYREASQSGVAAAAFGAGLPVVATPVGGVAEQVIDGRTGVLAGAATSEALAAAIRRLAGDPVLYERIALSLRDTAAQRSTARFLDALLDVALRS